MSSEPTQPMRPASTLSTVPVAGDQATEIQDDSGQGGAPGGGVSQATVPRAVLSQRDVPAPAGDAAPQSDAPQADTAEADIPQADTSEADAAQVDTAQADAPQAGTAHADTAQAETPQADTAQADKIGRAHV